MRFIGILILILFLAVVQAGAQTNRNGIIYRGEQKFLPCMDMGVGYIFDHKYKKYTVSMSFNNIYDQRYGFFAMLELDFVAPALVIGPTITIYDWAYIYAGVDFFTSRGMFARHGFEHARKDLGITLYPWKWMMVKLAHSFNAGSRAEIGIRVPLVSEANYLRTRTRLKGR